MKQKEIKYLKLLGYKDTQEEGAILQHKLIGCFIWEGTVFEDVLAFHNMNIINATRRNIAFAINDFKYELK